MSYNTTRASSPGASVCRGSKVSQFGQPTYYLQSDSNGGMDPYAQVTRGFFG